MRKSEILSASLQSVLYVDGVTNCRFFDLYTPCKITAPVNYLYSTQRAKWRNYSLIVAVTGVV